MAEFNSEPKMLEEQMCFHLYTVAREAVKNFHKYLAPYGFTYTQYIAMLVLWEKGCVNVSRMGEWLHLDSGTLTPLLKGLEKKGYITRTRSREDERVVNITLTPLGDEMRKIVKNVPQHCEMCDLLTDEEKRVFRSLLRKLLNEQPSED